MELNLDDPEEGAAEGVHDPPHEEDRWHLFRISVKIDLGIDLGIPFETRISL